jgi:hypothetical protein
MVKRRLALSLVLFSSLFMLASVVPSVAANRYKILSQSNPATGLNYKNIADSVGPNRIYVLTIDPKTQLTMDVALAGDQLGHFEKTSSMASRHGAIAAVNGDFGISPGYPAYGFAEDGDLKISRTGWGANFAVSQDEQDIYVGPPGSHFDLAFDELDTSETWVVNQWNFHAPASGQLNGYTPVGGSVSPPPRRSCYGQLQTNGGLMWSSDQTAVVQPSLVKARACQKSALSPRYGATMAAVPGTAQGDELKTLTVGESVRTSWSFGWRGTMDVIGGTPMLMQNGAVVATNCGDSLCQRNPRTGVGYTADGKILLVVVDGRQAGWSVGMTLVEFAQLFQYLGATTAMNMDGGGSSTMVLQGQIKNRPSDSTGERAVANAILVLNGPDRGEPVPSAFGSAITSEASPAGPPVPTDDALGARSMRLAALDPGSTGGMVDAVARGALGSRPAVLPAEWLETLRLFRSAYPF